LSDDEDAAQPSQSSQVSQASVATTHSTASEKDRDKSDKDFVSRPPHDGVAEALEHLYARGTKLLLISPLQLAALVRSFACPACGGRERELVATGVTRTGSAIRVRYRCSTCWETKANEKQWDSQPPVRKQQKDETRRSSKATLYDGNVRLTAALFITGMLPESFSRCLRAAGILFISTQTIFTYQRDYVFALVQRRVDAQRASIFEDINRRRRAGEQICFGGDAGMHTEGHCAVFGTYALTDMATGQVVVAANIRRGRGGTAQGIELEGLIACLTILVINGVDFDILVTDEHNQVWHSVYGKVYALLYSTYVVKSATNIM